MLLGKSVVAFNFRHKLCPIHSIRLIGNMATKQLYDYFLILDFEATCVDKGCIEPQEIIEFPVLKINASTLETEATFHRYVQPTVHKELTPFCMQLTGIAQSMVDSQPSLEETLEEFDAWMSSQGLLDPNVKSVFVTCGDWDLKFMLPGQLKYFNIPHKDYFKQWINIKKLMALNFGKYPKGLIGMLHYFDMELEGRHHSGIDDCKNIARILTAIVNSGVQCQKPTGQL